jgi:hypothetical protein
MELSVAEADLAMRVANLAMEVEELRSKSTRLGLELTFNPNADQDNERPILFLLKGQEVLPTWEHLIQEPCG